jgi:hypothetical protein
MKPRHPIAGLDCEATARAEARRAFTRRVAALTTTGLLLIAAATGLLSSLVSAQ